MEWGRGCRVRMIHADYENIIAHMPHANFVDASNTIWAVRGVKSPYEQDLLRKVNNINTKLVRAWPMLALSPESLLNEACTTAW